jgi:hypothetical protein
MSRPTAEFSYMKKHISLVGVSADYESIEKRVV